MKKFTALLTVAALVVISMVFSVFAYAEPSGGGDGTSRNTLPILPITGSGSTTGDTSGGGDGETSSTDDTSSSGLPTADNSSELPPVSIEDVIDASKFTATLSCTNYVYNGKAKKPAVTVKDTKKKTVASSNYTVKYTGNTNVGKGTVVITFKNNYKGTIKKTFVINPQATSLTKLTPGKKQLTIQWKKQATQTKGYQIQYATNSKFTQNKKTVTVTSNKTVKKVVTSLKKGKTYYVRIRTYKTVSGTNYYSSWSKTMSKKITK